MTRRAVITGWGRCVPPVALTNADLERLCDTSDEWIVARTGISERRISHVEGTDLAELAARRALACSSLHPRSPEFAQYHHSSAPVSEFRYPLQVATVIHVSLENP